MRYLVTSLLDGESPACTTRRGPLAAAELNGIAGEVAAVLLVSRMRPAWFTAI